MTGDKKAFGSRSYEYAVGCIKASSHPPISREKMARLAEADFDSAVRLLTEYGYPQFSYEKGETVFDSIEAEKERTVSFIMEIAPDAELVSAMFFEEDALNLKLCLKARLMEKSMDTLPTVNGSIDSGLLAACVMAEDFSMLGKTASDMLEGVCDITDAALVSSMADRAMFSRAMEFVKAKHCKPLTELFCEYAMCKNRITAYRIRNLGMELEELSHAFLPVDDMYKYDYSQDITKDEAEIIDSANARLSSVMTSLGYESGMGPVAEYYFLKKNEAASLRLLFAEKQLEKAENTERGEDNK